MINRKPEFTDKQLKLIEDSITSLYGDEIFDKHGHTPEELNEVWWMCKEYRIKFRRCKECNCHTSINDLSEFQICKSCQENLRETCLHPVYMDYVCTTCGWKWGEKK